MLDKERIKKNESKVIRHLPEISEMHLIYWFNAYVVLLTCCSPQELCADTGQLCSP